MSLVFSMGTWAIMIFMKIGVGTFVGVVALFLPISVSAQVVINEFLYDASGTDVDQEYVELYNSGASSVDLTKWKINDGSNHMLNVPPKNGGTGSIELPAGGYALLVDNATNFIAAHAGLSGTVIDTVLSLPNLGGTITLLDEAGATADSVSYTKDLGAAGDGNSLQKNAGAWLAALPTPGISNATDSYVAPVTDASTTETTSVTTQTQNTPLPAPVSSYVPPPVPQLFSDAGGDRTVIVGADTQFNGRAYNRQKEHVEHVRFLWNFGDGSTADGPAVVHHYTYPGRYAGMLTIAQNLDAVSDRIVVTAEPAKLAFDVPSDGSVAIENHAGRDLDLSGWIVRSTGQLFTLPEGSVILSNETMRIPQKTLKFWSGTQTELDYPNGVVVLRANESSGMVVPAPVSAPSPSPVPSVAPVARAQAAPSGKPAQEDLPEEITADTAPTASPEGQTAAAAAAVSSNGMYWWLGALALSALAGGAVFVVRRIKAGEWDIVEET